MIRFALFSAAALSLMVSIAQPAMAEGYTGGNGVAVTNGLPSFNGLPSTNGLGSPNGVTATPSTAARAVHVQFPGAR